MSGHALAKAAFAMSEAIKEALAAPGVDADLIDTLVNRLWRTEKVPFQIVERPRSGEEIMTTGDGSFAIGSRVWPGTSKVLEEMGELTQVLGKLIATGGDRQHWDGDLIPRLIEELGDLVAALTFFGKCNLSDGEQDAVLERAEVKIELFEKWHTTKTSTNG